MAIFGLLLVTPLEQWVVNKWDIAEVTFAYLNIISANFQPNPLAIWQVIIHKYIHTTSSISIRFASMTQTLGWPHVNMLNSILSAQYSGIVRTKLPMAVRQTLIPVQ